RRAAPCARRQTRILSLLDAMTIARALEAGRERSTRVRTMARWIGQLANERVSCPGGAVIVAPRPLACAPARRETGRLCRANRTILCSPEVTSGFACCRQRR